jgi:aryl carrier-like protein
MKSDKELFKLARLYVGLNDEFQKATDYEKDEIKEGLEDIRNILLTKGYDVDKFVYFQQLYKTMTIGEYFEFIKTLE